MLANGRYSAWFETPLAQGTGIIVLENGNISGEDTVIAYSGFYEQDGDNFTAVVRAKRYCEGQPSVFGVDEFELKLKGRSTGTVVVCSGTTDQAPGLLFKATLIRSQDQVFEPKHESPQLSPFNSALFPKIHGGR